MRFLVIDDGGESRVAMRWLLERRGHTVVAEAASGEEALAAANRFEPDAVLLDLRLRGESGLDVSRALTDMWPELPVMVVSMTAVSSELVRAYGARAFVSKDDLLEVDLAPLVEARVAR